MCVRSLVCVCVRASMCVALSSNRYTTVSLRGSWYREDGHSEGVGSMPEGGGRHWVPSPTLSLLRSTESTAKHTSILKVSGTSYCT